MLIQFPSSGVSGSPSHVPLSHSQDEPRSPYRNCFKTMGKNVAADLLRYGKSKSGVISLAQGEGTLPTPSFICEAVTKSLSEGKTFYSAGAGLTELREEIAAYHQRVYGTDISLNRITVTSSGTNAVHLALLSILEEGDDVVAVTPIWKNLIGITELAGGHIHEIPMELQNGQWTLDLERLFAACTPKTRAIMIVSPNNPTGWVMGLDDIRKVMDFARVRGLWVIADEVYGRTTHHMERAPSFLDVAYPEDRLYVVNSFSKTWAMTGWRLGWLIGPPDSEDKVRDLVLYENMGPPTFSQHAGIVALREGEGFLVEQKKRWMENQGLVRASLVSLPKVELAHTDSAFYAFFRVVGEEDSFTLARTLIDEAGVSLAPGGAFGKGFNDYLRLCFAASPEVVFEAMRRLEPFLR